MDELPMIAEVGKGLKPVTSKVYQGVTKRCRQFCLTNNALVYDPKCGWRGGGGVAGSQPMSTAVHRSPNKLWSSNSIFNLWFTLFFFSTASVVAFKVPYSFMLRIVMVRFGPVYSVHCTSAHISG
jgi:hypothetical protein